MALTAWGKETYYYNPQWSEIFAWAGWKEVQSLFPWQTTHRTIQQQYLCHVASAKLAPKSKVGRSWDLEIYHRENATWVWNVWKHECNW